MRALQTKTQHLLISMIPLALAFTLIAAVGQARKAARESQCHGNLSGQIHIALLNLRDRLGGHYPPLVTLGPDGKPMYGWRAQVHREAAGSYFGIGYDFAQPWNCAGNLKAARVGWRMFNCPNNQTEAGPMTNFVAVIDRGVSTLALASAIPPGFPAEAKQVLVIEYPNSDILWTEPRDLDVTELAKLADGNDSKGLGVLFADGKFRRIPRAEVLKLFGR